MSGFRLPTPRALILTDLVLFAMFWVAMPVQVPESVAVLIQAARGALSAIVVISYGWSVWKIRGERIPDASHGLIIGIFLAFSADLLGSILGIAWRISGRPTEWTGAQFWMFSSYVTALAAIHHIAVPGAIDGKVPKRNVVLVGIALVISGLVAGVIIGMQIKDRLTI